MRGLLFFRSAAVLIFIFAAGHTLGFRQTDPRWGLDATLTALKSIRFMAQGFSRTYWDFYVGFGLFVSVFLVLGAILAWQLGSLSPELFRRMRTTAWALTLSFGLNAVLAWRYFFPAPLVFSVLIFSLLLAGTLRSSASR